MNHSNKDEKSLAESEEGRPLIKENTHQVSTLQTQTGTRVSQGLAGPKASHQKQHAEDTRPAIRIPVESIVVMIHAPCGGLSTYRDAYRSAGC